MDHRPGHRPAPAGTAGVRRCANGGCDELATCSDEGDQVVCTCPDGYESQDEGATCTDIQECANNYGGCDQARGTCIESGIPGDPAICGCQEGYRFPEGGGPFCECDGIAGAEQAYLWVSNSPEGTVSKIDTTNVVEVARYVSGPAGRQDPSRTAVSLDGRFMVVANRNGGISMIAANEEDCVDLNNNGAIDTSTAPNDVRPWGTDECVIWNRELPASGSQGPRPVAWTLTDINQETCQYAMGNVWVGWYDGSVGYFALLDGATGMELDRVQFPWTGGNWGPYGGAIDSLNNFWVVGWGNSGPLIKVDAVTHQVTTFGNPTSGFYYGMGMAPNGSVIIGGCDGNIYHFDTMTDTWAPPSSTGGCLRGVQIDSEGRAWAAKNGGCGLVLYDTETRQVINNNISLPGCSTPVGVSIDQDGYVWIVDQGGFAYKMDPETFQTQRVDGLVGPYTYSDMTGVALRLQSGPIVD